MEGFYTHIKFLDVFFEIVATNIMDNGNIGVIGYWWNRGQVEPFKISSDYETIIIKKDEINNWEKYETRSLHLRK